MLRKIATNQVVCRSYSNTELSLLSFFTRPATVIEPIGGDFAGPCAKIHKDCFAHPWSSQDLEAMIASSAFVADGAIQMPSRKLLGFILTRCIADEAEVMTVAVLASARRNGIAALLLDNHLQRLRTLRAVRLFLEVSEANLPARRLYSKFGFTAVGVRDGYYRTIDGANSNALVLAKDLI
jgi:ribosomal-protein-alanine N-acetyltransferase